MTNRAGRKHIAASTIDIIKAGFYKVPGKDPSTEEVVTIEESTRKCDDNTKTFFNNDLDLLFGFYFLEGSNQGQQHNTMFEVTDEFSISCCKRLYDEGFKNITCLNFASAKNPGGGFKGGSLAQEESLCLCSSLYSSLSKQENHYKANKRDPKDGLYQNSLIFSPACPIFRNDTDYALLDHPFLVNFISCPAVNSSLKRMSLDIVRDTMRLRTKAVLTVAANEGCDALVLGSWGTGVFGNDVKDVAQYFEEFLLTETDSLLPNSSSSLANTFPKVVFAVGKDIKKQETFENTFLTK